MKNIKTDQKKIYSNDTTNKPIQETSQYEKQDNIYDKRVKLLSNLKDILMPFACSTKIYIYSSTKSGKSTLAKKITDLVPSYNLIVFSERENDIYKRGDNDYLGSLKSEFYKGYKSKYLVKFINNIYDKQESNIKPTFVIFDEINITADTYKSMLQNSAVKSIWENRQLPIIYIFIENSDGKISPNLGFNIGFDYLFIGKNALNEKDTEMNKICNILNNSESEIPHEFSNNNSKSNVGRPLSMINNYKGNYILLNSETSDIFLFISDWIFGSEGSKRILKRMSEKQNYFIKDFRKKRSRSRSKSGNIEISVSSNDESDLEINEKRNYKSNNSSDDVDLKKKHKYKKSQHKDNQNSEKYINHNNEEILSEILGKINTILDIFTPQTVKKINHTLNVALDYVLKYSNDNARILVDTDSDIDNKNNLASNDNIK